MSSLSCESGPVPLRAPLSVTAVVDAADPADPRAWAALLGRLRASGRRHHLVSGHAPGPELVSEALLAGAGGWLFEPAGPAQQPARSPRPRWYGATAADGRSVRLSAREVDVIQGIADGRSLPRIGRDLSLSTVTVRNHATRASRRLGARSRAHMVILALRAGVVR